MVQIWFLQSAAQLWICYGPKSCADRVERKSSNSPNRRPQLTSSATRFVRALQLTVAEKDVKKLFDTLDANSDGRVLTTELLKALYPPPPPAGARRPRTGAPIVELFRTKLRDHGVQPIEMKDWFRQVPQPEPYP